MPACSGAAYILVLQGLGFSPKFAGSCDLFFHDTPFSILKVRRIVLDFVWQAGSDGSITRLKLREHYGGFEGWWLDLGLKLKDLARGFLGFLNQTLQDSFLI